MAEELIANKIEKELNSEIVVSCQPMSQTKCSPVENTTTEFDDSQTLDGEKQKLPDEPVVTQLESSGVVQRRTGEYVISSNDTDTRDPDVDLRDDLVKESANDEMEERYSLTLSESLQKLCGLDGSAKELLLMSERAMDKAEELVCRAWEAGKIVIEHSHLPNWLRDNEFVISGHRPPLKSFASCFRSIFRIHTETANIWTHLIGFLAFIILAASFLNSEDIRFEEKIMFSIFLWSTVICFGLSWLYHTCYCHSEEVGRLFCKMDYCGITLIIVGSFVPWVYYSFYSDWTSMITYLVLMILIGSACFYVSLSDYYYSTQFRPFRTGLFISLGMIVLIPIVHCIVSDGFHRAFHNAGLGWMFLMGFLYLAGTFFYASRIPECYWPGRFDIWFSSHQIFHVFTVTASLVHYYGMSTIRHKHQTSGTYSDSTSDIAS